MRLLEKHKYTPEEYLELDHNSEEKIEYWNGHIFTLAAASEIHNQIQSNLNFHLPSRLAGKNCRVYPSDMRIKVPAYPPYRYTDLSALCGERSIETLGKQDLLVNPSVIFEVLSESTAEFDRGYKFTYYKSIESFTEYVLIAQDRPHVSQFIKMGENDWRNYEFNSLEDKFYLNAVECELTLAEIYQDVEFPERDNRVRFFAENE